MPKQVQLRRGTTGQTAVFTGAQGEVTVDTDKKTVVHDGSTAGGFALLREADGFKRSNNLSEVSSRSTAQDNLDVLWADDARGMASNRAPRGGLAFDGVASFRISGASPIDIGLSDFSVSFVARLVDYTPSTMHVFFVSHQSGNNRVQVQLLTDGRLSLQFHDSGGVITNYSVASDVALVDGEIYHFVLACDRDGLAILYVNGVSDRSKDGSATTVSIAAAAAIDIGSGNVSAWGGCYATMGTVYAMRVYNRVLSATEVLALVKAGDVASNDQWGSWARFIPWIFQRGRIPGRNRWSRRMSRAWETLMGSMVRTTGWR